MNSGYKFVFVLCIQSHSWQQRQHAQADAGGAREEWHPMQQATPLNSSTTFQQLGSVYPRAIPGQSGPSPILGQPRFVPTGQQSIAMQVPLGQFPHQGQGQFQFQGQGQFPYHSQGQFPYQGQGQSQFRSAQPYNPGGQFGGGPGPVLNGPGMPGPSGVNFPLQGSPQIQQRQQISPQLLRQQQQQV